eukprot:TRINITY_DN7496_c0_g1_i2.p1 TRINITY_DN7496_c0_g1~~TRINITY_DN7496_c0_g1_i2.p1  ORF type:complete len:365 (-),score=21.49 TRINITY_DN7496_c0_g1_i2:167-1183(-)
MGSRFAQWLLMSLLSQSQPYRLRTHSHTPHATVYPTPHATVYPCNASGASCPEPPCSSGKPVKMHFFFHLIKDGGPSALTACGHGVQANPLMHWAVALGKTRGCDAKSIFDDNAVIVQNCNQGPDDWWNGLPNLSVTKGIQKANDLWEQVLQNTNDFWNQLPSFHDVKEEVQNISFGDMGERVAYKVCRQSWTSYLAWFPPLATSVYGEWLGWRHVGWMCARNESEAANYIVDRITGELDLKNMPHERQEDFGADENNTMMYSDTAYYNPGGSYLSLGAKHLNCQNLVDIIDRLVLNNTWSSHFRMGFNYTNYKWLDQSGLAWRCDNPSKPRCSSSHE